MLDRESYCYSNSCSSNSCVQSTLELHRKLQGMKFEIDDLQYIIKKIQHENKQLLEVQKEMAGHNHNQNLNLNPYNCSYKSYSMQSHPYLHPYNSLCSTIPQPEQVLDPYARYKVKVQSLEEELNKKTQRIYELQKENRRLVNANRNLKNENKNNTEDHTLNDKVPNTILKEETFNKEIETFEKEADKLQSKVEKLNDSIEKFNKLKTENLTADVVK